MTLEEARRNVASAFFLEARSDFVGLWLLVKWVREELAPTDQDKAREVTLAIIYDGLKSGRVAAGEFEDKRFARWDVSPETALRRIDKAWSKLGEDPNIGDVVWLVSASLLV
jgi:hypothetical protein